MDKETDKAIEVAATKYRRSVWGKSKSPGFLGCEEDFIQGARFGIQLQKDKARVLEEALEFYADPHCSSCIDADFYSTDDEGTDLWRGGGTKARDALAKYRGSDG